MGHLCGNENFLECEGTHTEEASEATVDILSQLKDGVKPSVGNKQGDNCQRLCCQLSVALITKFQHNAAESL